MSTFEAGNCDSITWREDGCKQNERWKIMWIRNRRNSKAFPHLLVLFCLLQVCPGHKCRCELLWLRSWSCDLQPVLLLITPSQAIKVQPLKRRSSIPLNRWAWWLSALPKPFQPGTASLRARLSAWEGCKIRVRVYSNYIDIILYKNMCVNPWQVRHFKALFKPPGVNHNPMSPWRW